MEWIRQSKWWLIGMAATVFYATPPMAHPVSAYSGGFYDDGLVDDDWYFDYYEGRGAGGSGRSDTSSPFEGQKQYKASQLYDNAGESGLFRSTGSESFLKTAAQEQQAELALGHLAIQKASDSQVKQFAARMIEDHKKANREIQQLASQQGTQLPTEMNERQREKVDELSQLSGRPFDLAYIQYMMKDHKEDVEELELQAQQIEDPDIKQWASNTLPLLKQHLKKAFSVAMSLGPKNLFSKETTEDLYE